MHELVQLHARARRLRRDRVGRRREPLDAGDGELQILPARGEDLLVQDRVAGVGGERPGVQVLGAQRRQDAHQHHVRTDRVRLVLGGVEARADGRLELVEHLAVEQPRRQVDLHVELRELGLERVVGDPLQHLGVGEGRIAGLVGQVELDLQPDRPPLGFEARLAQHPREDVEVPLDLVAVPAPILAAEDGRGDVLAHGRDHTRTRAGQDSSAGRRPAGAVSPATAGSSPRSSATSVRTTRGSNWVPAPARSSATAASAPSALRYGRSEVIA